MAEFDGKEGYWVTINGNHIFVEKGKTLSQAFTDFLIYNDNHENDKNYSLNNYNEDIKYIHNIEQNGKYIFNIRDKGRKIIKSDSLLEALDKLNDNDEISSFNINGKTYSFNIGHNINYRKVENIRKDVLLGNIK